jgi:hypothetical protein
MDAAYDVVVAALAVAAVIVVVGACAQGRLKHWILVALGAIPKEAAPRPFDAIPRTQDEWATLANDDDADVARRGHAAA